LFTGTSEARNRMGWVINNFNALEYVLTGIDRPSGYIFEWLHRGRTGA
jgi:hypothetical protein